jgi:DNA-binding CsgD family transcriptional regulator
MKSIARLIKELLDGYRSVKELSLILDISENLVYDQILLLKEVGFEVSMKGEDYFIPINQKTKSSLKLTKRKREFKKCSESGMTLEETAVFLGISYASASALKIKMGLDFYNKRKVSNTLERLREFAEKGMTISESAAELDLSYTRIATLCKEHSIKIKLKSNFSEKKDQFLEYAKAGLTLHEAAAKLGLPYTNAVYWRKKLGVTFKRQAPTSLSNKE